MRDYISGFLRTVRDYISGFLRTVRDYILDLLRTVRDYILDLLSTVPDYNNLPSVCMIHVFSLKKPRLRWLFIRRTYISKLYDSGVNPDTIRRLAGHENIE